MLRRIVSLTALALCAIALSGCAAKEFTAVQMSQAGDEALDCSAIAQQIAANDQQMEQYVKKDKQVENGNVAKGVISATPYVGLLFVGSYDLSNEEQVKARSLSDRNQQLNYLAKRKGCTT